MGALRERLADNILPYGALLAKNAPGSIRFRGPLNTVYLYINDT